MRKKDKLGRWVKRVHGEYSNKVLGLRLTDDEYSLVMRARKNGYEPRALMMDAIRDKLEGGGNHASAE